MTATCVSLTSIRVNWTANEVTPYVGSYQVARSGNSGTSWTNLDTPVTATSATSYSYTDSGLGLGTYIYRVTATKSNWQKTSANSNSRSLTVVVCS